VITLLSYCSSVRLLRAYISEISCLDTGDQECDNDNNPCTYEDKCIDHICRGTEIYCEPLDQCHIGTCDTVSGQCSNTPTVSYFTTFPRNGIICNEESNREIDDFPTTESEVTITFTDKTTNFDPVQTIERTFTATDACGSGSRVQSIHTCNALGLKLADVNLVQDLLTLLNLNLFSSFWVKSSTINLSLGECSYTRPVYNFIAISDKCSKKHQVLCEGRSDICSSEICVQGTCI